MKKHLTKMLVVWGGLVSGAFLTFLTQVLLANTLYVKDYGFLVSTITILTIVSPVALFGLDGVLIRKFGRKEGNALEWVRAGLRLVGLCLISIFSFLYIVFLLDITGEEKGISLLIMFPIIILQAFSTLAVIKSQLLGRYGWVALFKIIPQSNRFLVAIIVSLLLGLGVDSIIIAYGAASLVISILLFLYIKDFTHINANKKVDYQVNHKVRLTELTSESWPFAIGGFFSLIYLQSDIVMLSWIVGDAAAGIYGVGVAFLLLAYLLPSAIYNYYLWPKLHYIEKNNRQRLLEVYRFGCPMMLIVGILTMFFMFIAVPLVIPILFSQSYAESITIFFILGASIPFRYVATSVGGVLLTNEYMKLKVWYQGGAALINIALNVWLINIYGIKGAAVATVLSEIFLASLYLVAVRNHVFGKDAWKGWHLDMKKINA